MIMPWYHNIPQYFDSIAFSVGSIDIRWYAMYWIVSVVIMWWLLVCRNKRRESPDGITREVIDDMILWAFLGAVLGGRLGYVVLYNWSFFRVHPIAIFSPIDQYGVWVGISGLSFHGGMIGVIIVLFFVIRYYHLNLLQTADFIIPVIPLLSLFGRLGNFINHELYGRVTNYQWGMYFVSAPDGGVLLRHPSQLYELFTEGIVLFLTLWILRNKFYQFPGILTVMYFIGYASMRFCIEFVREPDVQVGMIGFFTMGQILSISMLSFGIIILIYSITKRKSKFFGYKVI